MENQYSDHNVYYLARITIEATTPMSIKNGNKNALTDAVINRDVNGLPFIPATTLQGLLRHALNDKDTAERMMGYGGTKQDGGYGSCMAITEARLVGSNGQVIDGLTDRGTIEQDEIYRHFLAGLPIRQHVRITEKGVAANQGKFDEEIIPQGARITFEMELRADEQQGKADFSKLLSLLKSDTFRIGGGSRKGFGEIEVRASHTATIHLGNPEEREGYLEKSSSLAKEWSKFAETVIPEADKKEDCIKYKLKLTPRDFIFFSNGLGNEETDMDTIKEPMIDWTGGKGTWIDSEQTIVVPAASVKGAIAHRTAYHYNLDHGIYADEKTEDELKSHIGKNNEAVYALFGREDDADGKVARRGHVLVGDIVRVKGHDTASKTINHVKIDRFTGGAIEGALFDEQPLFAKNEKAFNLTFIVLPDKEKIDNAVLNAFEEALKDVCRGLLPLGGGVNRGNGSFTGSLTRTSNNETKVIYSEPK